MKKGIESRVSFEILRYANCWEDADILIKALNIGKDSNCLSIASAGDNSLALLTQNPGMVLAVDLSQAQIAVTELRKAALGELDYPGMLQFLGFREPGQDRLLTYKSLEPHLSRESREYFDANREMLQKGVIHCGKFENYFRMFRRYVLPLVHRKRKVCGLLERKGIPEQEEFYHRKWNTVSWRLMFNIFFSRFVMGRLGRDPEFFRHVEGSVADRILERTKYALTQLPVYRNPYVNYILTGSFNDALPFYAREENFQAIRNNLSALVIFKGSTDEALKAYDIGFDAFNLSDIFEYMDPDLFKQVSLNLLEHANPGARLAYWNMLAQRRISTVHPAKTSFLEQFSQQLFREDNAFFYKSFYVDERLIKK